jgi:hypothetical protein
MRRRRFHRAVLCAAGAWNIAFGIHAAIDAQWLFRCAGMAPLNQAPVFACLGMVVGLYGLLYLEAARAPERGRAIVAVGLLGKVLGPIGMAWLIATGAWPPRAAVLCVGNDVVWWLPFALYLWDARRGRAMTSRTRTRGSINVTSTLLAPRGRLRKSELVGGRPRTALTVAALRRRQLLDATRTHAADKPGRGRRERAGHLRPDHQLQLAGNEQWHHFQADQLHESSLQRLLPAERQLLPGRAELDPVDPPHLVVGHPGRLPWHHRASYAPRLLHARAGLHPHLHGGALGAPH